MVQSSRSYRWRFLAGQTARLQADAIGEFSIASCSCAERRLEFHIPRRDDDAFCRYIFENCSGGDMLQVTAPDGEFVFTEEFITRPMILIGFGIGFAPIKSLFEHISAQESEIPLKLYWVSPAGTHYLANLCRSWGDTLDQVEYQPLAMDFNSAADCGQLVAECVNEIAAAQRASLPVADIYCCAPASAQFPVIQALADYQNQGWRLFYEPIRYRTIP